MLKSFENFMSLVNRKNLRNNTSKTHNCRVEFLEERALLSAMPLSAQEYADLRAQYADFNLPENMADLNVITLDLAEGDDLATLKSAITEADTTTHSDLIVVRTSTDASALTYTANTDELSINIDASQYGSITIIGLGPENLTLDANLKSRAMNIDGSSTIANLGGLMIKNGTKDGYGGGIYIEESTVTITNCKFLANTSWYGGGIYNDEGSLTISASKITGNVANGSYSSGGGIYNHSDNISIINTEISGNKASYKGGGFYQDEDFQTPEGTSNIINCTIAGNAAFYGGSGIYNLSEFLTVTNSIVSQNYSDNILGSLADNSGNNLTDVYAAGFVCAPRFTRDGELINADMIDLHLRSDSMAINGGNNSAASGLSTDIVGLNRVYGDTVDMGAYEYQGDRNDESIPFPVVVDTLNDSFDLFDYEWSLREAIYYADENATITFDPKLNGQITLTQGQLEIDKALTIDGDNRITIDAAQRSRVFYIETGSTDDSVVFNGLTIRNGKADYGGGINNIGSALTITNSTISNNTATQNAGGIYVQSNGILTMTNTVLSNNYASVGGGVYQLNSASTITDCTFSDNMASRYGGGFYQHSGESTLFNIIITNNVAVEYGGGIYLTWTTTTITDCSITSNIAAYGGGISTSGALTINNSDISGNTATRHGGGIQLSESSAELTVSNSTITNNTAYTESGGGIYNDSNGVINVSSSKISGNKALQYGNGGGVWSSGTFTITDSNFLNNSAANFGGGIYNQGTFTITNCNLSGNEALQGGGVYNATNPESSYYYGQSSQYTVFTATNCTISSNTATEKGGGIYNEAGNDYSGNSNQQLPVINSFNCTITGNSAVQGSGIYNNSGLLAVENSIVSLNYFDNIIGDLSSDNNNLINHPDPGFVYGPIFDSEGNLTNVSTMDLRIREGYVAENIGNENNQGGSQTTEPISYSSVVNTCNDSFDPNDNEWSLREAVYYAEEYVTITFAEDLVDPIVLTQGQIVIEKPLVIEGSGRIIIDGNQKNQIFYIDAGTENNPVVLKDLVIRNGNAKTGGGIYQKNGFTTVSDCIISGNTASSSGGGIFVYTGTFTVDNCTITNNSASFGAGFNQLYGTTTITNSTISFNTASQNGGGIYNYEGNATIVNCAVFGNSAIQGGGMYEIGTNTIINSTFAGNTAVQGGGVYNHGNLTVKNSILSMNKASSGGGLCNTANQSDTVNVYDSLVSLNFSDDDSVNVYGPINWSNQTEDRRNLIGSYDPGFVVAPVFDSEGNLTNANTLDLHLRSDSVAVDRGDSSILAGIEKDLNGNARIIGTKPDLGACEYQGGRNDQPISYSSFVNTLNDSFDPNDNEWSLREAIYYAPANETITFADSLKGVIVLSLGHLTIEKPLAIDGDGRITIDADRKGRSFYINTGTYSYLTVLNGLTIQHGIATDGGGIYLQDCKAAVSNCVIIDNTAMNKGGGVMIESGDLLMTNSIISGNAASSGGAVYKENGLFTITNSTIADNTASSKGGGLYVVYPSHSNLNNSIVVRNEATNGNDIYLPSGVLNAHNNISSYTGWDMNDNIEYAPLNPLFVNADIRDYSLDSGSQAINRGSNQYALEAGLDETSTDLYGEPRYLGESVDVGAYESIEFSASQTDIYRGDVIFSWKQYKNTANVRLVWLAGANRTVLGTFGSVGEYTWDTTQFANEYGELRAEYLDENGSLWMSSVQIGLILNDENVVIHRDNITESETWTEDKVHLLAKSILVANSTNLTIAPNTVVKFLNNSHIEATEGSTLTIQNNVIFTRAEDDSVVGDTNLDGVLSKPGIGSPYTCGTGTFNIDASVSMKYVILNVGGTISSNQTWRDGCVYHVTDNITVKNNVTLTIMPGAIIKFDSEKSLIVESGGTLIAEGTVNHPIVFTSFKDDDFGGDSNKDSDYTAPDYGDWNQIRVSGTASLDHVIIRYAGSSTSGINGALYGTDNCIVSLQNSVLEFTRFHAISASGGKFTVVNTVARCCKSALVNIQSVVCNASFTNCTFADSVNFLWCGWGRTQFVNCIVSNIISSFAGSSSYANFQNCVFWNSKSVGEQSFYPLGSNGNRWANPLFRNAAEGDYHLMAGSPCIDAGVEENAPDTDITGTTRTSDPHTDGGGVVDIGAYEFVERVQTTIDLETLQIQVPISVTSGQSAAVQWTIANNGTTIAKGRWTDAFYLVNEITGQTVLVKEYTHNGSIGANSVQTFSTELLIPYVTEGIWKFQLRVNINRDLYEGFAINNNVVLAEAITNIQTPILTESHGLIETSKNRPMVYKVNVNAGSSFSLKTNSSEPISVYMRENQIPNTSSYDYIATQYNDIGQTLYIASLNTDRIFYLLVETSADSALVEYDIQLNEALSLLGVSPQEVSNKGTSTLTFTGTGFNSNMTVWLQSGSQIVYGTNLTVISGSSAVATFDLLNKPLGKYTLFAKFNDQTVSCPAQITVKSGVGEALEWDLELPESIREERIYTGKLYYENTGDCDMLLPGYTLSGQEDVLLGWSADSVTETDLYVICPGANESAGILRAGESGEITFYFLSKEMTPVTATVWDSDVENIYDSLCWTTWNDFHTDLSDTVTRLVKRGNKGITYEDVYDYLVNQKSGWETNGLSGFLRDARTHEPLSGVYLTASWENGNRYDLAVTDETGHYVFNFLPTNTQLTISPLKNDLKAYGLSQTLVYVGESDYNNFNLTALPYGAISGRVASITDESLENILVVAWSDDGNYGIAFTDENGKYEISGLPLGQYHVDVESAGVYNAPELKNTNVNSGQTTLGIDFTLAQGIMGHTSQNKLSNDQYTTIVNTFDELTFPDSAQDLNVFRLNDDTFTAYNLIRAIYISSFTTEDDLILVDSSKTIELNGMPIDFYIDSEQYGIVSIIGIGDEHAKIKVNPDYPTFYVTAGVLQLGAVDFVSIATDDNWSNLGSIFDQPMISSTSDMAGEVRTQDVNYFDKQGNNIFETYFELVEEDGEFHYVEITDTALPSPMAVMSNDSGTVSYDYSHNYVVLFAGGGTKEDLKERREKNSPEFYNDIKKTYLACVNNYHVPRNNIYIIYADGTNTSADKIVNGKAVNSDMSVFNGSKIYSARYSKDEKDGKIKSNLEIACNNLRERIQNDPDAHILVYTFDHGGARNSDGEWLGYQFLVGWGTYVNEKGKTRKCTIKDTEFARITDFGGAYTTYVMCQCFSGGMLEDLIYNGHVFAMSSVDASHVGLGSSTSGFSVTFVTYFQKGNSIALAYSGKNKSASGWNLFERIMDDNAYFKYRQDAKNGKLRVNIKPSDPDYNPHNIYPQNPMMRGSTFPIFQKYEYKLSAPQLEILSRRKYEKYKDTELVRIGWKLKDNYSYEVYLGVTVVVDGKVQAQDGDIVLTITDKNRDKSVNENGMYWGPLGNKWVMDFPVARWSRCTAKADGSVTWKLAVRAFKGNNYSKWSNMINIVWGPKSQDPNEIRGPQGGDFDWHNEGTEDEPFMVIDGANWIKNEEYQENAYKIYFENKKTAAAAAQEITVKTTLPEEMDWNTFQVDQIALGQDVYTLSDESRIDENTWLVNQASTGEQVKIRYDFDAQTGEATWYLRSYVRDTFDNFPEDAYDGILPPNDDNHSGEGYISYRVRYDSDLVTGDVVSTSATIIFDHNEAIETNVWHNTIDVDVPVSEMSTEYVMGNGNVTLNWTGSDIGSGIAGYNLYVSVNGGNFTLVNSYLTGTSYTYDFEETGSHSFKVISIDGAGNVEDKVQSEITVTCDSLPSLLTILTTQETSLESHVVSATENPINEWNTVYVEMWYEEGIDKTFTMEYNSDLYTLDTESCRTQEGATLQFSDVNVENGITTLTVSLDASDFVTNGANTLLASLKLTPNDSTNNLTVGESAEGIVWVNGDALATTVYSVIYDLNESGSVEINDLVAFARLFGQKTAENPNAWKADFNCDERVDISDLVLFARNFGLMTASSSQIRYDANYTPHVEEVQPAAPALPALETSVAWENPTWSGTTQNLVPEPAAALPTVTDRAWNDIWSELEEEEEERLAEQRKTAELAWF